jgi:TetR/AcrR family transcriptional regulator of autoinduction and epiphytic fitness
MSGRKRDTSKKRTSILDAAKEAFIKDGYDNASMDRIAELAGASKRTVYNHFPSKEDLFRAMLGRLMEETIHLKQVRYDATRPLATQLGEFADAKQAISRNPSWLGMIKVTIGVFIGNPELGREVLKRAEDEEDFLVTWLEAATEDGRLKVTDPALAAEAFWSMVGGAFFWPSLFLGPMKTSRSKAMKKELISMFLSRYEV